MSEHLDCSTFKGVSTERSSMELLWKIAEQITPIDCRKSPADAGQVVSLAHYSREANLQGFTTTLQSFRWTNTVSENRDQLYRLIGLPEIEQFKALYITKVHLPTVLSHCALGKEVRCSPNGKEFALVFPVMPGDWRMLTLHHDYQAKRLTWAPSAGLIP